MDSYSDFGVNDPFILLLTMIYYRPVEPLLLPAVSYPDTINYLVFTPVRIRRNTRAYKHACNEVCGVRIVLTMKTNNLRVTKKKGQITTVCIVNVMLQVYHSQKHKAEKPLKSWIIAQRDGLSPTWLHGEACTYVAGSGTFSLLHKINQLLK